MDNMVDRADVVVIGGGVIGVSTAFHLAKAGAGKVTLLERRFLGAGASGKQRNQAGRDARRGSAACRQPTPPGTRLGGPGADGGAASRGHVRGAWRWHRH